jgi:O-antigen/teichoic acid export membrane protein
MSFKNSAVKALFFTNFFSNVIRLLSNLVIARVLSPEAFAITGLASTIIFTFNMLSDGGFRSFVLRHKDGENVTLLTTLWTVKLFRNVFLALLLFSTSGFLGDFFEISEMSSVLKVLSLVFIFEALKPMADFVAERQNRVATVMYLHFVCYLLSTAVIVIGVYLYQTYWAIIVGMLANGLFVVVGSYLVLGLKGIGFRLNKDVLVEFMAWAKYIIPSSIITLLLMQLDKLIFSKALSVSELGLYYVAFNFSSAAMTLSVQFARKVLQPKMSKVFRENLSQFKEIYYDSRWRVSLIIAGGLGALSGASFIFFDVLYDDRYVQSAYFLSILLVSPVLALITYPSETALIIYGELRMTLVANLFRLTSFLLISLVGYYYLGVVGILIAVATIELFPGSYMLYKLKDKELLCLHKELAILLSAGIGFSVGRLFETLY